MPSPSISGPEPSESATSAGASPFAKMAAPDAVTTSESDFTLLANRLAEHGNGIFSMQLTADLALEIVLNEIVEQACLTMRASGAAIILEREGELVCRACSGSTAPGLGTRLDTDAGLSGECIRTLHSQRCDDAQSDPRADAEACLQLGVRSVMVLPLLRKGRLVGVFEVFSSEPFAFGEREERTAEAFAHRIIKNLERAAEPLQVAAPPLAAVEAPLNLTENVAIPAGVMESLQAGLESIDPGGTMLTEDKPAARRGYSLEILTWALAIMVLACILLVGQRFVFHASHASSAKPVPAQKILPSNPQTKPAGISSDANTTPANNSLASNTKPTNEVKPRIADTPPAGSLLVYENGREVFRMAPSQAGATDQSTATQPTAALERASAVDPDRVVELSPDAAEGSLLHRVEPEYPEGARQQQIQGPVVLNVHVAADGSVQNVAVVSGPPLLADAAIHAVKQWRFRPRMKQDVPVEMQTRITLNFKLPE